MSFTARFRRTKTDDILRGDITLRLNQQERITIHHEIKHLPKPVPGYYTIVYEYLDGYQYRTVSRNLPLGWERHDLPLPGLNPAQYGTEKLKRIWIEWQP